MLVVETLPLDREAALPLSDWNTPHTSSSVEIDALIRVIVGFVRYVVNLWPNGRHAQVIPCILDLQRHILIVLHQLANVCRGTRPGISQDRLFSCT